MASIPQSHSINNYWGPFKTETEAVAAVVTNCGECRGVIWLKNGDYWSSEGKDCFSDVLWTNLPAGARVVDMLDVYQD
jgi:hypothetical protein